MYSHQGTEPTFEKETPGGADASANAAANMDAAADTDAGEDVPLLQS